MTSLISQQPIFINEGKVKSVLSWKSVNQAVEEALKAASTKSETSNNSLLPYSHQPARSFTFTEKKSGVLLTMPGFVGNYNLNGESFNTLACKLVTCFKDNENRNPPMPSIIANIMLFHETGQLKCIMEGTEITAWRTAAASIVATNYLYIQNKRCENVRKPILAIIGCGVQGRIHAIGFAHTFDLSEIRLWNRTSSLAESLATELQENCNKFVNKDVKITAMSTIESCVSDADVIVTATFSSEPLIYIEMLKPNVHINAVGAGVNHHSEISHSTYDKSKVFIDSWENAKNELKDLQANIVCEVGEIINGTKSAPTEGITVFQSMGMASEDVTVAQMVYNAVVKNEV